MTTYSTGKYPKVPVKIGMRIAIAIDIAFLPFLFWGCTVSQVSSASITNVLGPELTKEAVQSIARKKQIHYRHSNNKVLCN